MQELSRRKFIQAAAVATAAAGLATTGLAGCQQQAADDQAAATDGADASTDASSAPEKIPVTVGYWGGTCESPIFIGVEQGIFEEEGLDVDVLQITADVAPLMANDELDCFELTPDKFKPIQNGLEVKIIDSLHIGCIGGAASVESGIKTVADLEGKTVAASIGSIPQIQIASQMVLAGKDPNKVNWVTYPNAEMELALDNGEIDAFAAYDPFPSMAWENGKVRFFSNTYDEGLKEYLCCFVGLSDRALNRENGTELARRLSAAFKRSCAFLQENPDEAAQIVQTAGYIAGDAEMNAHCISEYTWVAGDKQLLDDSVYEIWMQIYRAGALEEAPKDEAELDAYIKELRAGMVAYYGD
ncbi:MAG: ABC transporter substrate-binding protein [Coriobacteriales bacterium]|jgi:NitT/TauT family transport system substrate-binding protein|nr:ABC transporter substrate-binding protein [Coriobacteriales bacterium]